MCNKVINSCLVVFAVLFMNTFTVSTTHAQAGGETVGTLPHLMAGPSADPLVLDRASEALAARVCGGDAWPDSGASQCVSFTHNGCRCNSTCTPQGNWTCVLSNGSHANGGCDNNCAWTTTGGGGGQS